LEQEVDMLDFVMIVAGVGVLLYLSTKLIDAINRLKRTIHNAKRGPR